MAAASRQAGGGIGGSNSRKGRERFVNLLSPIVAIDLPASQFSRRPGQQERVSHRLACRASAPCAPDFYVESGSGYTRSVTGRNAARAAVPPLTAARRLQAAWPPSPGPSPLSELLSTMTSKAACINIAMLNNAVLCCPPPSHSHCRVLGGTPCCTHRPRVASPAAQPRCPRQAVRRRRAVRAAAAATVRLAEAADLPSLLELERLTAGGASWSDAQVEVRECCHQKAGGCPARLRLQHHGTLSEQPLVCRVACTALLVAQLLPCSSACCGRTSVHCLTLFPPNLHGPPVLPGGADTAACNSVSG